MARTNADNPRILFSVIPRIPRPFFTTAIFKATFHAPAARSKAHGKNRQFFKMWFLDIAAMIGHRIQKPTALACRV
jgi:hypothetical protein